MHFPTVPIKFQYAVHCLFSTVRFHSKSEFSIDLPLSRPPIYSNQNHIRQAAKGLEHIPLLSAFLIPLSAAVAFQFILLSFVLRIVPLHSFLNGLKSALDTRLSDKKDLEFFSRTDLFARLPTSFMIQFI